MNVDSFRYLSRRGYSFSGARMFLTKWTGTKRDRQTGERALRWKKRRP